MAFSKRMAALTAVVAIPLGVAATSYALTDDPEDPSPPARVEMEGGSSSPPGSGSPSTGTSPGGETGKETGKETVSPPPVRDGPSTDPSGSASGDDDADDTGDDSGGGNDDDELDD